VISYERGNEVYCDYNQQYTSLVIWDRYSVTVNQVMMATVKIFKVTTSTYRSDRVRFLVVTQLVLFCVVFCRSLSFVRWPLYYLSYYLRFLITPLVSSNIVLVCINPLSSSGIRTNREIFTSIFLHNILHFFWFHRRELWCSVLLVTDKNCCG
jgi:hypothetical protein